MAESFRRVLSLCSIVLLQGCAITDTYSPRVIAYNLEAEEAGNQALLLNIVRSSLHRPMQFTGVQNIVGSTSETGSLSASIPFYQTQPTSTGMTTGSLTGSTTFTVPVFDTQEFYQGLLAPIQGATFDYLFSRPFSRQLLFNLLVERITVDSSAGDCPQHPHDQRCERDFRNNPLNLEDVALFQQFASYLISMQLTTEAIKSPEKDAIVPKDASRKGTVINITNTSSSSSGDAPSKPKTTYRLCFSPRSNANVDRQAQCGGYKRPAGTANQAETAKSATVAGVPIEGGLVDALRATIGRIEADRPERNSYGPFVDSLAISKAVAITIDLRSTADVFNFLGQIVEARRGGHVIGVRGGNADYGAAPCAIEATTACRPMLEVDEPANGAAFVEVSYSGRSFSIPGDVERSYSPEVLAILKTLLVLNVSAKSLPTTAILSVTPTQ